MRPVAFPANAPAKARSSRAALFARTALGGAFFAAAALASGGVAQGAPSGPSIPSGVTNSPTITTPSAGQTTVTLNQTRTIIDWKSFDIAKGETVDFVFNSANGIALNRVNGAASINGALNGCVVTCATIGGAVWVYAPNGVIFGPNARVNAGSFLASTAAPSEADFLSGSYNLTFNGANPLGRIQVQSGAELNAHGGSLALIAPEIETQAGSSLTSAGTTLLGAAQNFRIHFDESAGGDLDLFDFQVPSSALEDGTISAKPLSVNGSVAGGSVVLAAVSRPSVMNAVISLGGLVTATKASSGEGGSIVLTGSGSSGSTVDVSGVLRAAGGKVDVTAPKVTLEGTIDVSAPAGGGVVRLGGGGAGQDPTIANANTLTVAPGAVIDASATEKGDGGAVTLWSNTATDFRGAILSRGGPNGGDGGNAEVSGGWLNYAGTTDLTAAKGRWGMLLLDPDTVNILSTGTGGGTITGGTNVDGGNGTTTTISVSQINAALDSADVTIKTYHSDGAGGTITFNDGVGAYAFDHVSATPTHTAGLLTFSADNFTFSPTQAISAGSGISLNFTQNGALTLNTAVSTTATGAVTTPPATAGSITLQGTSVAVNAAVTAGTAQAGENVVLTATGGGITQSGAIKANTLTATATGPATVSAGIVLNASNQVGTLNASANSTSALGVYTASDISFTNAAPLTVAGAATNAGNVSITTTGGTNALTLGGAVTATNQTVGLATTEGGAVTLTSAGATTQSSGIITAAGLSATASGGDLTLAKANKVSGAISNLTGSNVAFNNDQATSIAAANVHTAGTLALTTSTGGLTVSGALTTPGALTLTAAGALSADAVTATTGTLSMTGSSITFGGAVQATAGSVALTTTASDLGLTQAVTASSTAGTVTLTSSGAITETGGVVSGHALSGSSAGGATLGGANTVGALTGFTNTGAGGFSFTNAASLTVSGAVNPGSSTASITTTGATSDLTISATVAHAASFTAGRNLEVTGGLTLDHDLTATATAGNVTFDGTVDGAQVLTTSGTTTVFGGAVGLGTALTSISVTGASQAAADIKTSGAMALGTGLTLTGPVTLTSTGAGITVGTIDSDTTAARALTVAPKAGFAFTAAAIGGGHPLASLDVKGLASLSGGVTATGAITFENALTLTGASTLTSTGSGAVQVTTVDSATPQAFGVSTAGGFTASAALGGTNALASLSLNVGTASLSTGNNVGVLAANLVGPGAGLTFSNGAHALSVGSAGGVTGITTSNGDVSLTSGTLAFNNGAGLGTGVLTLSTTGAITQTGGITAGGLQVTSTDSVSLGAVNNVGTLAAHLTTAGKALSFNNGANALVIGTVGGLSGVVTTTNGAATLGAGVLTLNQAVNVGGGAGGGALSLTAAGVITQAAAGVITAHTLQITGSDDVTLGNTANAFDSLLASSAVSSGVGKAFTLYDASALSLDGNLTGGAVSLKSGSTITQNSGVINAASLTGAANGGASFNKANQIGALANFSVTTTGAFSLTNDASHSLTVTGAVVAPGSIALQGAGLTVGSNGNGSVQAGTGVTLTSTGSNPLTLAGNVTASTVAGNAVALTSGGDISQTGGKITAYTATVDAVGSVSLDKANVLTQLGNISAGGDTSITNDGNLTVTGTFTAKVSTTPKLALTSTNGNLTLSNAVTAPSNLTLKAGGTLTTQANTVHGDYSVTAAMFAGNALQPVFVGTTNNFSVTQTAGSVDVASISAVTTPGTLSVTASAGAITDSTPAAVIQAGGLNFTGTSVTVGALKATNAAIGLNATGGSVQLNGNIDATGQAVTLSAVGGLIGQAGGTGITSATLSAVTSGAGAGSTLLGGPNHVGELVNLDGVGATYAGSGSGVLVVDAANARTGALNISNTGGLQIAGTVQAGAATGAQTLSLTSSGGSVTETGSGAIIGGALTASSSGGLALGGSNQVGTVTSLVNAGAGNLVFVDTVTSPISVATVTAGTGNLTLQTGGDVTLTGVLSAGQTATLTIGGQLAQNAGSSLTAGTLTGIGHGGFSLNQSGNSFGTVSALSDTGAITLTDSVGLTVAGAVTAGSSALTITAPSLTVGVGGSLIGGSQTLTTTGALSLASGPISAGGLITINAGGAVTQGSAGVITAGSLSATGSSVALATAANQVGLVTQLNGTTGAALQDTLGTAVSIAAANGGSGALSISNTGGLNVTGTVQAGTAAGSQALSLTSSSGLVTESGSGSILGGVLTAEGGLGVTLTGPNNTVAQLASLKDTGSNTAGVSYVNTAGLAVNAADASAGNLSITASSGNLALNGPVTAGAAVGTQTATLIATTGAVSEGGGGAVTAGTVTGSGANGFALTSGSNAIGRLQAIEAGSGALNVADSVDLTLGGALHSLAGVTFSNSAHTITEDSNAVITGSTLTASSTGGLSLGGANQVGTATSLVNTGSGDLLFVDALAGPVTIATATAETGALTLQTAQNATLTGTLSAGSGQTATLTIGGALSQTGGSLTAGLLTGTSHGGFSLNQTGNSFGQVGPLTDTTGAITLVDSAGLSVVGAVSAGGALSITAPSLTVNTGGSLTAASESLTTTGAVQIAAGSVSSTGALVVNAGGAVSQGAGTVDVGSLQVTAVGGITLPSLQTPSIVSLGNSGSGDIAVTLTGSTISGAVTNTAPAGAVTVLAPAGSLQFTGAVQASGALILTSLGALSGTSVTAGGATALTGAGVSFSGAVSGGPQVVVTANGGQASFGSLSGTQDVTVTGGLISVGTALNVGRDLTLTGTGFSGVALTPTFAPGTGRDFFLTDTQGGLNFSGLSQPIHAPRDLIVVATDPGAGDSAPIVGGSLVSDTGRISVSGTSLALVGVAAPTNGVILTATAGGIGLSGLTNAGSSTAQLTAATTVTETGAGAIHAGTLSVASGGAITLAGANAVPSVTALTNSGSGGVLFNDTSGSVTIASVTTGGGDIGLSTPGGALQLLSNVSAPGSLTIMAAGALTAPALTAQSGALTVTANGVTLSGDATAATNAGIDAGSGNSSLQNVSATAGNVTLKGAAITALTVAAGQDATVQGTGAFAANQITAGRDLTLSAASVAAPIASAGRTATLTTTGNANLGTLTAGAGVGANVGGSLQATSIAAQGGDATLHANAMTVGTLSATGGVTTTSTGDTSITTLTAGQNFSATTGGAFSSTTTTAGGSATLNAGTNATLGSLTAGAGASLTAGGSLQATSVAAQGGNATLHANAITVGALSASGGVATTSAGDTSITTLTAGQTDVATAGGAYSATHTTTGGAATVTAGGAATFGDLTAGAGLSVMAGGPLQATTLVAQGGDAVLKASTLNVGTLTASGAVTTTSTGDTTVGALTSGTDATINAGGAFTATSATIGRNLQLTAGAAATLGALSGAAGGALSITAQNVTIGAPLGATPSSANILSAGGATVTIASATDIGVNVTGPAALTKLTAGRNVTVATAGGDASIGAVTLPGVLSVTARGGSANVGLINLANGGSGAIQADVDVVLGTGLAPPTAATLLNAGPTALTLKAGRNVAVGYANAIGFASVTAGGDAQIVSTGGALTLPTVQAGGNVQLTGTALALGSITAGGSLNGHATTGNAVLDTAVAGGDLSLVSDQGVAALRTVQMTGAVPGTRTLLVSAAKEASIGRPSDGAAGGVLNLADPGRTQVAVRSTGGGGDVARVDVTGDAQLSNVSSASGDVIVIATGGVTGAPAGASLFSAAKSLSVTAAGNVVMGGLSTAGTGAVLDVGGALTLASLTADHATLRATDLTLTGALQATQACGTACTAPTLAIESRTGPLTVGDAPPGVTLTHAGLTLDNSELGRIKADALTLYAGNTTNAAARGDVQIGDATLDGGAVKTLTVLAGSANTVSVLGTVAPVTANSGNLVIGGAKASDGWTPKSIYVTGALGKPGPAPTQAGVALKSVSLNAVNDVLIGSPTFVTAVTAAEDHGGANVINITRGLPIGVAPTAENLNKTIVTTGALTLRADGYVVQQNTGAVGTQGGVFITNPDHLANALVLGRTGTGAGAALTPNLIDLSLSITNASGTVLGRQIAASSPAISLENLQHSDFYRVNGCGIGASSSCTPLPNTIVDIRINKLVEGVQISTESPPAIDDPTITGAGNEEIWRSPPSKPGQARASR